MRFDLRPAVWMFALAIIVTVCGPQKVAAAQPSQQGDEHNARHDDDRNRDIANNPHYQQGLRNGQDDRSNNRDRQYRQHPDNDNDRRAYEAGYNQGYQSYRNSDRNDDRRDGDNHDRDADRYGNRNPGYRMGFQDGINDGQGDRASGRRFKYGKGYKHPDRGYVSSYGDKRSYEQQYREAYQKAYQQGYSGQGDEHRR